MVNYRRNFLAGGTYFFTVTLANQTSTALVDHVDELKAAIQATQSTAPFAIDAAVVLPDHLHAVFTLPPNDANYSGRWKRIKVLFSNSLIAKGVPLQRHANGELALWQRRFWEHTIRDESDFARHVDYIHFNPVKHGMVTRVRDWPHSSFHRYVRAGLLPIDWAGDVKTSANHKFGE